MVVQAYYGLYGGEIGNFLSILEQNGFFAYALPFLLIFALVYAILVKVKVFQDTKSIPGIIALTVGLMALQFEVVPQFFSVIFPKLGVGLAVLLVLLILGGMFMPRRTWMNLTLLGIAAIIIIIVLVQTADDLGWPAAYWWTANWPLVAGIVVFLIIIGVIVGSSNSQPNTKQHLGKFLEDLGGGLSKKD